MRAIRLGGGGNALATAAAGKVVETCRCDDESAVPAGARLAKRIGLGGSGGGGADADSMHGRRPGPIAPN